MHIARRFVQRKVWHRTVLAAGLVAAAAMLSGIAASPVASAAPSSSARPDFVPRCGWGESNGGSVTDVIFEYCSDGTIRGFEGYYTGLSAIGGHFEVYGPHGFIGNTAEGVWANSPATLFFSPQSAPSGSRFCAIFWTPILGGGWEQLDNNCVTI